MSEEATDAGGTPPAPISLDIRGVMAALPHRYPLLLVDRVVELVVGERIHAIKAVSMNEQFFQGHFPGAPLLPAVLMVESLSQVAAILVRDHEATPQTRVYLRGVNGAKFRRQVVPGDRLRLLYGLFTTLCVRTRARQEAV